MGGASELVWLRPTHRTCNGALRLFLSLEEEQWRVGWGWWDGRREACRADLCVSVFQNGVRRQTNCEVMTLGVPRVWGCFGLLLGLVSQTLHLTFDVYCDRGEPSLKAMTHLALI